MGRYFWPGILIAVLLAILAVFGFRRFAFTSAVQAGWLRSVPIAHRGLHTATLDENSLGAFQNAMDHGYAVELDVRLTRDGVAVVHHDKNLLRMGRGGPEISSLTWADLSGFPLPASGESIPSLAQALQLINGKVPVLIEIKNFGLPGALENAVISETAGYPGEYAIQSYNPLVCRYVKRNSPDSTVGLLLTDATPLGSAFTRNLKDNLFTVVCKPGFIAYNLDLLNAGMAEAYRKNGTIVLGFVYRVRDAALLISKRFSDRVDNVIFEFSQEPGSAE